MRAILGLINRLIGNNLLRMELELVESFLGKELTRLNATRLFSAKSCLIDYSLGHGLRFIQPICFSEIRRTNEDSTASSDENEAAER